MSDNIIGARELSRLEIIKKIINRIDKHFKTNIYRSAKKILEFWYYSDFLNTIRRNIGPNIVRLKYKLGIKHEKALKLHLGCGHRRFEGYINVDWRKTGATDLVCDIRNLPYTDDSVDLIENYHLIEHLPRHDLQKILYKWNKILKSGGRLIIECPDFDESVKKYLEGDEDQLDGIFGLQRFKGDYHFFGYNFNRLSKMLRESGFLRIAKKDAEDYHAKELPCIRIECIKE